MVRSRRLELPRSFLHSDLNAARLPVPPRPHISFFLAATQGVTDIWLWGDSKSPGPDQAPSQGNTPMTRVYDDSRQLEWLKSPDPVPYPEAVQFMENRVAAIHAQQSPEALWFLEHPPLYTAGTSADPAELVDPDRFPVYETGRGGRYTYHGPGQRVGYVMMDLSHRKNDIRAFAIDLEEWIITTLAEFGIQGERRDGRVGIWVARGEREDKIAAIGVRVRRWISYHGIAINVAPNLDHFSGIVPCGISGFGVTSLSDLGIDVKMEDVDTVMTKIFQNTFGNRLEAGPTPNISTSEIA